LAVRFTAASRVAVAVAVIMSLAGCGGSDTRALPPTTPSAASPAANWTGTISDPIFGNGTAGLSLGDDGRGALTGTWSATFANGNRFSGPAAASLVRPNNYGITLYVEPPPPCAGDGSGGSELLGFTLINVAVTSSRLTAIAGRLSCSGPGFGSINLSRQ
jgi:hypothetical protein